MEIASAEALAAQWGFRFAARGRREGVGQLLTRLAVDSLVVAGRGAPRLVGADGSVFFWHPGPARLRVGDLRTGRRGPLLRVLSTLRAELADGPGRRPLRVLDATLGHGHDALAMAADGAQVLGLEVQPVLAMLTAEGLAQLAKTTVAATDAAPASLDETLRQAAGDIDVVCADHAAWLADAGADTFDAVVLNPMWQDPDAPTHTARWLRREGERGWPEPAVFAAAMRVAPTVLVRSHHRHVGPMPAPRHVERGKRGMDVFVIRR